MPFLQASRRKHYWKLLLIGIGGFAALTALAVLSGHTYLVHAALVVGAFVGPVLSVTYLAESNILAHRLQALALTFLLAAPGVPIAFFLEQASGAGPGQLVPAMQVGVIEESIKLLAVSWLLRRRPFRFEMDGIVYGAAAGMGFAAFENLHLGLSRIEMGGLVLLMLWLRTLMSPFGHGTWTAIACAAVWRVKGAGSPRWDWKVAGALATSIALHGCWDWQPLPGALNLLWLLAVGAAGVVILRVVIQRAATEELSAVLALNPEVAQARPELLRTICRVCGQLSVAGAHYCARCGVALKRRDGESSSSAPG